MLDIVDYKNIAVGEGEWLSLGYMDLPLFHCAAKHAEHDEHAELEVLNWEG